MTELDQRVLAALGDSVPQTLWEQLIALFQADREAFYRLACEGVAPAENGRAAPL